MIKHILNKNTLKQMVTYLIFIICISCAQNEVLKESTPDHLTPTETMKPSESQLQTITLEPTLNNEEIITITPSPTLIPPPTSINTFPQEALTPSYRLLQLSDIPTGMYIVDSVNQVFNIEGYYLGRLAAFDVEGVVSPNKKYIAFSSTSYGYDFAIVDLVNQKLIPIDLPGVAVMVIPIMWSPESLNVYLISWDQRTDQKTFGKIDMRNLLFSELPFWNGSMFSASWSPDGKTIAKVTNEYLVTPQIIDVVIYDANCFKDLSPCEDNIIRHFHNENISYSSVSFSPDSTRVVMECYFVNEGFVDICIGNIYSGEIINITEGSEINEKSPHWSPDGKWIAILGDGVELIRVDGFVRTKVEGIEDFGYWLDIP